VSRRRRCTTVMPLITPGVAPSSGDGSLPTLSALLIVNTGRDTVLAPRRWQTAGITTATMHLRVPYNSPQHRHLPPDPGLRPTWCAASLLRALGSSIAACSPVDVLRCLTYIAVETASR
jgi:hypothetical protein